METIADASSADTAAPTTAPDPSTTTADPTPEEVPAAPAPAPRRGTRGATTSKVLAALAGGGAMTATDVAETTGLGRATVSSTLSRLSRTGAVTKAERGYQLTADPTSGATTRRRAAAQAAPKPKSRTRSRAAAAPKAARAAAPKAARAAAPKAAREPARTAPGATKAKILAALSADRGMTAGEVAAATGLGRGTVSTTLSKLAKGGEVDKADRGYRLAG